MQKLTFLLIACCALTLPALAQEEVLKHKANDFMAKHKAEWEDLEPHFSDSALRAHFQEHAFYKAFDIFLKDNGNQYAALRTARFQQYGAPPAASKAFAWKSLPSMDAAQHEMDLMSIVFIRSFDPAFPARIAAEMLIPGIAAANNLPDAEMDAYYQKLQIFGAQIYAEPVSGDDWQIWYADRTYAVNFHFDIRNGKLEHLKYAPVSPIQWPASVAKPMDEASRLAAEQMRVAWDQYRTYDPEKAATYQQQHKAVIDSFYSQHQEQFITARTQELKPFVRQHPALTGYKELTAPGNYILQKADTIAYAHTFIYPEQWEVAIANVANGYFELGPNDRQKRMSRAGLYGVERYTQQVGPDQWEVWKLSDGEAIYYVWNLRTGLVDKVRYWISND